MNRRLETSASASEQPDGNAHVTKQPVHRVEVRLINRYRRVRWIIDCVECGSEIALAPCHVRLGRKFCSLSCASAFNYTDRLSHRWTVAEAKHVSVLGGLASGGHNKIDVHYRHRHPERARAHRMLNYRVKKGLIVRQPCERCGATERINGHHDDYSKPLAVRWLCTYCHRAHHMAGAKP